MSGPVDESTDEQLACRSRDGDRYAFAMLVERYWDGVYGWLYCLTRSTHDAEDLTQVTYCKAWAGLASYQSGPGFKAWLFRIARNSWIDHGRRAKSDPMGDLAASVIAPESNPLDIMLKNERISLLNKSIGELPDEYREALLLRCQGSLSFAEIGEVVGAKEDTVRWRVYKARQLLLQRLGNLLNQEEFLT